MIVWFQFGAMMTCRARVSYSTTRLCYSAGPSIHGQNIVITISVCHGTASVSALDKLCKLINKPLRILKN